MPLQSRPRLQTNDMDILKQSLSIEPGSIICYRVSPEIVNEEHFLVTSLIRRSCKRRRLSAIAAGEGGLSHVRYPIPIIWRPLLPQLIKIKYRRHRVHSHSTFVFIIVFLFIVPVVAHMHGVIVAVQRVFLLVRDLLFRLVL